MPRSSYGYAGTAAAGFLSSLGHAGGALNPFDNDEDVIAGQDECRLSGQTVNGCPSDTSSWCARGTTRRRAHRSEQRGLRAAHLHAQHGSPGLEVRRLLPGGRQALQRRGDRREAGRAARRFDGRAAHPVRGRLGRALWHVVWLDLRHEGLSDRCAWAAVLIVSVASRRDADDAGGEPSERARPAQTPEIDGTSRYRPYTRRALRTLVSLAALRYGAHRSESQPKPGAISRAGTERRSGCTNSCSRNDVSGTVST